MNADVKFYGRLMLRRAPVMLMLFLVCSAIGVVLALRLPTTYETTARLIVQPQQISEELVASTVQINALQEVRILQEQLMTRANLIDIANDHDVFEDIQSMLPNDVVSQMRDATRINATGGGGSNRSGGGSQPVLVSVSFRAGDPQTAANVVNDYVTRLTAENARIRAGAAGETLSFFEQEVARLGTELDLRSAEITEFQRANADALPDDQDFRMQRVTLLQERLAAAEREHRNLSETRERIQEIFETTGRVAGVSAASLSPEERELQQLERELTQALTVFSENAPQVQQLRRRIEGLQAAIGAQPTEDEGSASGPEALLNLQLAELDTRIAAITTLIAETEAEMVDLEDAIQRTPLNAITLQGLERDYENIRSQYDSAVARLSQASVGERIEVTARGQRISLIEPAAVPTSPASPNRPMIAGAGIGLGMVLAALFFLLMEFLNRTVRRPAEITARLGITPLAVLPYIESRRDVILRRGLRITVALATLIGVPAALWAVDTYYLPLDLIADRLLDRIGLS